MAVDYTVKIFNPFYNLNLVVNANEYEVVYSFFAGKFSSAAAAKSFTENLFMVANDTQISVMELLQSFEGQDSVKINLTMAYYLNSLGSKNVLYGVENVAAPNDLVLRNVILGESIQSVD